MDRAGIETMLMNYYRHIDRSRVQFDFLVNKKKPGDYDDEIRELGGRIYVSPGLSPLHYLKYQSYVKGIFVADPDIRVLHAHNEAMGLYALNAAKNAGIKARIAHAHNTRIIRDYKYPLKRFCKCFLTSSATELWSCGTAAGIFFFGSKAWNEKGMIMRNAIDTEPFAFDESIREHARRELGLGDKLVIGHVGRFNVQKNHARLLEIFAALLHIQPNAVLMLIGEGELESQMRQYSEKLGISDKVIFAGLRSDLGRWYAAMDVFVMPSLFEGLPVVGIEAQCAGLPCVFSENVTDEVLLSSDAVRISLDATDEEWAKAISRCAHDHKERACGVDIVRAAGYDITVEAERIEKLYTQLAAR